MDIEEIRKLAKEIIRNPEKINDLDDDTFEQVAKEFNPYGAIIKGKKSYINISITNLREERIRKFLMTSLIAYLYRTKEEFALEDEQDKIEKKYEALVREAADHHNIMRVKLSENKELLQEEERKYKAEVERLRKESRDEITRMNKTVKAIINKFLAKNLEFDPDRHVRGAHHDNDGSDPERKSKDDAIRDSMRVAETAPTHEETIRADPEAYFKFLKESTMASYQNTVQVTEQLESVISVLEDPQLDREDGIAILKKRLRSLREVAEGLRPTATAFSEAETLSAYNVQPPADVFQHFKRYIANHYEQLNTATNVLYRDKRDFDLAVIYYDHFKTSEDARDYRIQHDNEFRTDVYEIENNCVQFIGPFKENRKKVDFYNKNTEIFKQIMEQMEADHKLGKDLMEKQVKRKKAKNIAENGPDAKGLAEYSKTINKVQELGAKKILTSEEQDELAKAQRAKEQFEVPEDAIAVDMFYPTTDENGETVLGRKVLHTQSEAPLHLEENSPYSGQYQPKRAEGERPSYKTKIITDRNGNKKEIRIPTGAKE